MIIARSPLRISLGGGFLMFYTENKRALREVMIGAGVEELRFKFDFEGTKLVNLN